MRRSPPRPLSGNPIAGCWRSMREYELTVVYDLAVAEAGGPEAAVQLLTSAIEARSGRFLKADHWGRRRMAYPIGRALDADYVISRVELEPGAVSALEAAFRIDERVYRHLIVRADELPPPPTPREPRRQPEMAGAPTPAEAVAVAPVPEAAAEPLEAAAPAVAEAAEPVEASAPAVAEAASEPVEAAAPAMPETATEPEPAAPADEVLAATNAVTEPEPAAPVEAAARTGTAAAE